MKTETRKVDIFIAEDGTEFLDENSCIEYEATLQAFNARLESITHYQVHYAADCTEGRGLQASILISVEPYEYIDPILYLDQWLRAFAKPVEYVQGVAPTPGYRYSIIENPETVSHKVPRLFISNGARLEGFPEPCPLTVTEKDAFRRYTT